MSPIAYALASDTLIAVVRAWTLARHHDLDTALADDAATRLAVVGGLILWLLRLALAPGLHRGRVPRLVLPMPGRPRPPRPRPGRLRAPGLSPHPRSREGDQDRPVPFFGHRTDRPLASIPLDRVAWISAALAPQAGLNTGAAPTALRKAVLAGRNRKTR